MARLSTEEKVALSLKAMAWAEENKLEFSDATARRVAYQAFLESGKAVAKSSHPEKAHATILRPEGFEYLLLSAGISEVDVKKVMAIARGGAILSTFVATTSRAKDRAGEEIFSAMKLGAEQTQVRVVHVDPVE